MNARLDPATAALAVPRSSPREFPFTERDFDRIAARLKAVAGIDMPRSKEALVYSRLAKRLRALGLATFADYVKRLEDPAADETDHLLTALTTNVTRFFREPHHFDDLSASVLPRLAERARAGGRVRLWSAGCSSGQEPYSIGLCVLAAIPDAPSLDLRVLATDVNSKVLDDGRAGDYPREPFERAPKGAAERGFEDAGDGRMRASAALRRIVAFKRLNFIEEWPMKGLFDVIFCRNVMIYFDEATQSKIWSRLTDKLAPDGRLYIGHSERVLGPAGQRLSPCGPTAYRRKGVAS